MLLVSNPNKFPEDGFITLFSGKSTEDAIQLAKDWSERVGTSLLTYYPQKAFGGKSILVSYKNEEKS